MSDRHMDASVAAALAAGRSVIVPSPQRASALGLAWARMQLSAGHSVWSSPDILAWDAWIRREWQRASERASEGTSESPSLLGPGQEQLLWEQVLDELEPAGGLRQFAPELLRTAARAVQDGLRLSGTIASEEEALLVQALARVRQRCRRESLVALSLLAMDELGAVRIPAAPNAPLIAGQQQLTAMQSALARSGWPTAQLLAKTPDRSDGVVQLVRADSFEAEIDAAAEWCRQLLEQDGTRRLLVVSALAEPRLPALGNLMWRALSAGTAQETAVLRDPALLAIEGGEPLLEHGLIADALEALQLMLDPIETTQLGQVLLGPYLGLGSDGERARLELELRARGRARWTSQDLQLALSSLAPAHPVAGAVSAWLVPLARLRSARAATASAWARAFSDQLAQCGFAATEVLDSRDAQRLERWNELLDEFASLDCVSSPMSGAAALKHLRTLAARGRHRAASGDAAITLTDDLGDPVIHYDGIWVMGLSENRWPRPPRPNPFVPLSEQRRCNWPEAGVTQRMQQAQWAQQCWRARSAQLVLSYPAMEGDVHHRPSSLLAAPAEQWTKVTHSQPALRLGQASVVSDAQLPAMGTATADTTIADLPNSGLQRRLRNGVRLLELQQACAFRAQAQLRLGAVPADTTSDGIDRKLRGILLHRTLEGLWQEFQDQQSLALLNDSQRLDAIDRCWEQALLKGPADRLPADPRVMAREGLRNRRIIMRVLELETRRAPFRVREQEKSLPCVVDGWELTLRIDRVDELADHSQLLIDYKSGAPQRLQLDDANARPIQLAAYAAAMLAQGQPADAVALLSLSPKEQEIGFSGRARDASLLPGKIRAAEGWDELTTSWQLQIRQLVHTHVNGVAAVAPLAGACDLCHLDSLCRITDHPPAFDDEVASAMSDAHE